MKNALIVTIVIAIAVALFVLLFPFGDGTMAGSMMSGGTMDHGPNGGIGWMWVPTLLVVGVGALLVWIVFVKDK